MKKKIFFFILILFSQLNPVLGSISNKIIANVGSEIVTSYELKNKINTLIVLSNKEVNQSNIDRIKKIAVNELINLKMKKIELAKYNLEIDRNNLNSYLNKISSGNIQEFKNKFKINNLDYNFYLDEIKTQLTWQKLIFSLYKDKVIIEEKEINDDLKKSLKLNSTIKEYNLSEMDILLDNNTDLSKKLSEINFQIQNYGFEETAKQFSGSYSASDGGRIGWLSEKSLSNKILNRVKKLKINEISEPIISGNSLMLIKLNNVRVKQVQNLNTEDLRKSIIKQRKNELFSLYSNSHLSKIKNNLLVEYK